MLRDGHMRWSIHKVWNPEMVQLCILLAKIIQQMIVDFYQFFVHFLSNSFFSPQVNRCCCCCRRSCNPICRPGYYVNRAASCQSSPGWRSSSLGHWLVHVRPFQICYYYSAYVTSALKSSVHRPLTHGGHFESQENKKLCFCTSSLALDERLGVQNLLFQHCVIKVYCLRLRYRLFIRTDVAATGFDVNFCCHSNNFRDILIRCVTVHV